MNWLVTGASSGVGRVMARALAGAGHRVLLTARNQALLSDTQRSCPGSEVADADLSHLEAVAALAKLADTWAGPEGLAGIVHAAGVMLWDSPATPGGWSLVPVVNAVAPWRLTAGLEGALQRNGAPRVLFIAGAPFTLNGIQPHLNHWKGEQKGQGLTLALESAAAKVWMARELNRRWASKGSAFAFHPGYLRSHLADGLPFPINVVGFLAQPFLGTRCRNGEFLAFDSLASALSGNLVSNQKPFPLCPGSEEPVVEQEFLAHLN